jgi:hypothetical protein
VLCVYEGGKRGEKAKKAKKRKRKICLSRPPYILSWSAKSWEMRLVRLIQVRFSPQEDKKHVSALLVGSRVYVLRDHGVGVYRPLQMDLISVEINKIWRM